MCDVFLPMSLVVVIDAVISYNLILGDEKQRTLSPKNSPSTKRRKSKDKIIGYDGSEAFTKRRESKQLASVSDDIDDIEENLASASKEESNMVRIMMYLFSMRCPFSFNLVRSLST